MPKAETYDDHIVRLFLLAAAVWGVVGMSIGVLAAAQLAWPVFNFDISWLTFSRIRSNHTFGVIFAFGGSALMGTCYYVVQRTGHTRLALGGLARFTFWGWQLACLLAMATMPFGITQSKEYAEPEWLIDLLIAVVWVSFGVVFFATLARRRIRHIYVANWYYGAFIIAVALLHVVNNLALPVSAVQVLPDLFGRRRRDGAVVVRPQRGRFLPDRGLPRNDVLLRAAPGSATVVELSLLDREFLGADLHLHVGRRTSPAVHRVAGLGAVGRHGVLDTAGDAEPGIGRERPA